MELKKRSIDETRLPNRAKNAFHREQLHTVGDILELDEEQLMAFPYLGSKTVTLILEEVRRLRELEAAGDLPASFPEPEDPERWLTEPEGRVFAARYLAGRFSLDDVELLPVKGYNLLTFCGWDLERLLLAEDAELLALPRMTAGLAEEIRRAERSLMRREQQNLAEAWAQEAGKADLRKKVLLPEHREAVEGYVRAHDIPLDALGLANRPRNQLLKNGRRTLADFFFMTTEQLMALPNMGKTSVEGVMTAVGGYIDKHKDDLLRVLEGMDPEEEQPDDEKVTDLILELYRPLGFGGLRFADFREKLPQQLTDETVKRCVGRLLAAGELEYVDYRCHRVYPKFRDYIEQCTGLSERDREILRNRLKGVTLEEIGGAYGLTRERVRQIIVSRAEKVRRQYIRETGLELFDEDYYRHLYTTYDIDREDAQHWLGIPTDVSRYFECFRLKKGTGDLADALSDERLSIAIRLHVKNYLNRNMLFLDGTWVEKKRIRLEEFVVRKFCRETVTFEEFTEIYNRFLREEEIPEDTDLYITDAVRLTRKNRLSDSDFVLWTQNEHLRWYDIPGRDYGELYEQLNLDAYENVELSTRKLFRSYPETMKKYDLRDHYELHNLLRKTVKAGEFHDFHAGKMPMIRFGHFDRDEALLELLIACAPISQSAFAERVDEEFGYDPIQTQFNMLGALNAYYHQGMYDIDQKVMPPAHQQALLAALTGDFYFLDELREIFVRAVPGADLEELNSYNLKNMGFQVFSRYVLRGHDTMDGYCRSLLLSADVLDIRPFRRRFAYVQTFSATLMDLKRNLQLVEMEPGMVIRMEKLEAGGLTLQMIRSFCDAVYDWVEPGVCFSIRSIRQEGFESELFDFGFEDWFYGNLLYSDERFSSTRFMNNLIFRTDAGIFTLQTFLTQLIRQAQVIDTYDLMSKLEREYGCVGADKWEILRRVENTQVFYDRVLDRFYADAELYYRELDAAEEVGA